MFSDFFPDFFLSFFWVFATLNTWFLCSLGPWKIPLLCLPHQVWLFYLFLLNPPHSLSTQYGSGKAALSWDASFAFCHPVLKFKSHLSFCQKSGSFAQSGLFEFKCSKNSWSRSSRHLSSSAVSYIDVVQYLRFLIISHHLSREHHYKPVSWIFFRSTGRQVKLHPDLVTGEQVFVFR